MTPQEESSEPIALPLRYLCPVIYSLCVVSALYITQQAYRAWKSRNWGRRTRGGARLVRDAALMTLRKQVENGNMSPDESRDILSWSLDKLIGQMREGIVKVSDVLCVYQRAALEAHDVTNCLVNIIDEADQWAAEKDASANKTGLLFGVPVCVKEHFVVKGYRNTFGMTLPITFRPANDDCVLLKVLKKQGAIPFARTNLPQLLMSYECSNAIYGETRHPMDPTRTCGGSSGGDAALIAAGGSILDIGSDVGGSLRLPAAFCGIAGLKCSSLRLSLRSPSRPEGQTIIRPAWGPMARSVDTLTQACRALFVPDMSVLDANIPPVPFREDMYTSTQPLTVGYYVDDGWYPAVPACKRAVMETKNKLEELGHKLVPWQPPRVHFVMKAWASIMSADSGQRFMKLFGNEEVLDQSVQPFVDLLAMSCIGRWLRIQVARLTGQSRWADQLRNYTGQDGVSGWWQLCTHLEQYRRETEADWRRLGLDAVICPATIFPASKLCSSEILLRSGSYMMLYNVLDFPAGVVPVTKVLADDITALKDYHTGDDVEEFVRADAGGSEGLPVAVQCVAMRWNDELCLRLMKEVEEVLMMTASNAVPIHTSAVPILL